MKCNNNNKLSSNNYLLNSYNNIISSKIIHFIKIIIDVLLILIEEINISIKINNTEGNTCNLSIISLIIIQFIKLSKSIRIILYFLLQLYLIQYIYL